MNFIDSCNKSAPSAQLAVYKPPPFKYNEDRNITDLVPGLRIVDLESQRKLDNDEL